MKRRYWQPKSLMASRCRTAVVPFLCAVMMWSCSSTELIECSVTDFSPQPHLPEVRPSVHLLTQFDAEPREIAGWFFDDEFAGEIVDETMATETRCSQYVEGLEVDAGGNFDELFHASEAALRSLGVEPEEYDGEVVRVNFEMTKRVRERLEIGFDQCCREAPGGCPRRRIGESWAGSGTVYVPVEGDGTGPAENMDPDSERDMLDQRWGIFWAPVAEFEDQFFVFTTVTARRNMADCAWVHYVPEIDGGRYLVATHGFETTPTRARKKARAEVRDRFIADLIEEATSNVDIDAEMIADHREDSSWRRDFADVLQGVDECVEEVAAPDGPIYQVSVLKEVSSDDEREAVERIVEELVREDRKRR